MPRQVIETGLDGGLDAERDGQLVGRLVEQVLLAKGRHDLLDEERVARGAVDDGPHQIVRDRTAGGAFCELAHFPCAKPPEPKAGHAAVAEEAGPALVELRARGPEQEERPILEALAELVEHADGGVVGPLQVLDQEREGTVVRRGAEVVEHRHVQPVGHEQRVAAGGRERRALGHGHAEQLPEKEHALAVARGIERHVTREGKNPLPALFEGRLGVEAGPSARGGAETGARLEHVAEQGERDVAAQGLAAARQERDAATVLRHQPLHRTTQTALADARRTCEKHHARHRLVEDAHEAPAQVLHLEQPADGRGLASLVAQGYDGEGTPVLGELLRPVGQGVQREPAPEQRRGRWCDGHAPRLCGTRLLRRGHDLARDTEAGRTGPAGRDRHPHRALTARERGRDRAADLVALPRLGTEQAERLSTREQRDEHAAEIDDGALDGGRVAHPAREQHRDEPLLALHDDAGR